MSSSSRENFARVCTRRSYLKWASAIALAPIAVRADCPCGDELIAPAESKIARAASANVLRVCSDPNNLPFSNRDLEGFENKIASIVAKELGLTPCYDWLPQRLGFFRTALKTFDSQLVMAAPAGFDKALLTGPYYRSTYVFVTRKSTQAIKSFDDPRLKSLKVGVQLTGNVTPPTVALSRRKIVDNVVGFPVFDETKGRPAEKIIAAVASGDVDVAAVWGPQAGYFVKRQKVALEMTPVSPEVDGGGEGAMPFTFKICMAVRKGDAPLRDKAHRAIASRRSEIDQVLTDFNVPLLPVREEPALHPKQAVR
jgi:mxaJ protein